MQPARETRRALLSAVIAALLLMTLVTRSAAWAGPAQGGAADPAASQVFDPPDPARTRLNFLPTARTLDRGDVAIRLIGIPPPLVQVGLTDRVTMGAALLMFTGVALTPKVQVWRGEQTQAAVGAYHLAGGSGSGGLAYAVVTHGGADASFTVGSGWIYSGFLDTHGGAPVLLLGGERRVTPRGKIVAEAFVGRDALMTSVGVRYIRRRFALDFGAFTFISEGDVLALPMFNLSWRF